MTLLELVAMQLGAWWAVLLPVYQRKDETAAKVAEAVEAAQRDAQADDAAAKEKAKRDRRNARRRELYAQRKAERLAKAKDVAARANVLELPSLPRRLVVGEKP